jgi:beta-galactosidase/beta-glucuronidase
MKLSLEGRHLDRENPLPEYPTPQFKRDSYICLNGVWDFALDQSKVLPTDYPDQIVVPFAVETPLSEIHRRVGPNDVMHYRRTFTIPAGFNHGRILLHFEAVDQVCDVYLNRVKICHHEGGYLPFTTDLMELHAGENVLQVEVMDNTDGGLYARGKQTNDNQGIWYTPTSGIWQTVWLESVPNQVIRSLRLTPDFDQKVLRINADFEGKILNASAEITHGGHPIAKIMLDNRGSGMVDLHNNFTPWTPDNPYLYDLKVTINADTVSSYFAMRKCSMVDWNGFKVFGLNNKPLFLKGILDQGYFPGGGLTPPSDQAIVNDLRMVQGMGFNMIRKHIKVEPMIWYHHCDQMGLLVFQDFVCGGAPYKKRLMYLAPFFHFHFDDRKPSVIQDLGRIEPKSRSNFYEEVAGTVQRLYNTPSIIGWTLFNEGWGQFETIQNLSLLKAQDFTRPIDANSGWFDQGVGDFDSHHVYIKKIHLKNEHRRALLLSECGGYTLKVKDHAYSDKSFGYRKFTRGDDLAKAIYELYAKQIIPLIAKEGLCGSVFTQLSDVETEMNGLITYDREIIKVDSSVMRAINDKLVF